MDHPVALITGAARRVGRAVALQLAANGYDVAFTYLSSESEADSLSREIQAKGQTACAIRADRTDLPGTIEYISEQFQQFRPRLDALIHNASIYLPDSQLDDPSATDLWRAHVEAPLLLTRIFADRLKQAHGCVITMCDIMGERPMPGWLAYCASKAGLANLTLGMARELAPEARCCGIAPGVAQFPDDMSASQKDEYLARVPLRRAGTPEDVAKLVQFLLRDGSYITGQIIRLDGGRSIGF
jgi:pteridine reductase